MNAVTPETLAPAPTGVIREQAPAPAPEQPSSWMIVERPPTGVPSRAVASGTAADGAERRSATPLIIGLVVLLVLGGGAAIFALTRGGLGSTSATNTPNANSAFTKFTDADGVYSLNIPTTWLSTGNAALTTLGPAAQPGTRVEIERLEVALNNQQDSVASSFFTSAANSSGGSVSNQTGATPVTLAGTTWSQYTGDLTVGTTTEHIVLLIASHTTNTVILATLAPKSTFTSDDSQYFQPMLKSFAFLK